MGDGELKATLDAGPLIHLVEIGCLRFLNIFDTLCVPYAVWLETVEQSRISRNDFSNLTNIQQYTLPKPEVAQFVKENNLSQLHAGERECLFVCL